jgi:hypothetical protein
VETGDQLGGRPFARIMGMLQMKLGAVFLAAVVSLAPLAAASAEPVPKSFESTGDDRKAIEVLLQTYTKAVSGKDQALFETLLLNKQIPFSDAYSAVAAKGAEQGTQHYESFRKGVFEGAPFTQRFQDVHIDQDGPMANVSVVFVNTTAQGSSWGWKTLQLLKVGGRWKIASEFYTGHPG